MYNSTGNASIEMERNGMFTLDSEDENNTRDNNIEMEGELDVSTDPIYQMLPPECGGYGQMVSDLPEPTREYKPTRVIPPEECFGPCPKIVSRQDWGARIPTSQPEQMMFRVRPAVFKKSDCYNCSDPASCLINVKLLQMYQMDYLGFTDIAYSFMIGEDGKIYEGRGWGYACEKEVGFMGIGFLGYFTDEGTTKPSDEMLQLAYDLIMCGVLKGFVANPFVKWGEGQSPVQMMRDYIECEEDVDYMTKVDDPGIY